MQLNKFSALLAAVAALGIAVPPMIADAAPVVSTKSVKKDPKCKPGYFLKTVQGKGKLAGKTVKRCVLQLEKPTTTCKAPMVLKQTPVTQFVTVTVNGKPVKKRVPVLLGTVPPVAKTVQKCVTPPKPKPAPKSCRVGLKLVAGKCVKK